jgi:DNA-binding NtrC family response regulator
MVAGSPFSRHGADARAFVSTQSKEVWMRGPVEVMVLDDEDIVCERLKVHLEKKEYHVETFTDSQTAIDRLGEKRFDVVITDIKMQGPSGLDVLHFVRRQNPSTQVIIITGYGSIESIRETEFGGAFEFINKPFTSEAIETLTKKAAAKARKLIPADER